MCNPRRIRVRATRRLAEAWRAEIERTVTERGDVSGEARLVQPLASMLPGGARAAFERAMGGDPDWQWVDGEYRRDVPGGYTAYRPDTGELEIVVRLTSAIEVLGTARREVSGEVADEVSADASATYFTDGWMGMNQRTAKASAQREADAQVEELARLRAESLKREAEEAAAHRLSGESEDVEAAARRDAQERFTLRYEAERRDLERRAATRLDEIQQESLRGVFQLVAAGYAAALREYAEANGAEGFVMDESDGAIDIRFEMEA